MSNVLFDGLLGQADPRRIFARLGSERYYSYQDVLDVSGRMANVLVERGVKPGDRVAVQVPKSIEALMLYLGCMRAGAVFLPLNTAYTAAEVAYFLDNAEPALFVCDPARQDEFIDLAAGKSIALETLGVWQSHDTSAGTLADAGLAASSTFETVPRDTDDLAAILYTSGTTGRSKGAMLTHGNLLSNAEVLMDLWQFTSNDKLLHALPVFHTHGLFVATNIALLAGGSMIFLPGFNNDDVIAQLPHSTAMMGVPTFYTRLIDDERFTGDLVSHMRLFVSGSAPLLAETHVAFEERTGHRILERYGMTETNMITSNPYDADRRAGTVGFALPGVKVRICDSDSGSELERGKIGVLEVKGPNVFKGYWRMPEKTAEEFRPDGFFITGDMAMIDGDGYVHIVGRAKDLIISGGYNIYPKEVELLLDEQDGVAESAVIGAAHPDFGEGVVAVIVPLNGANLEPQTVMDAIKPQIARFKQPKHIFVVGELPRNTMGKVQKNILRERYKDVFQV